MRHLRTSEPRRPQSNGGRFFEIRRNCREQTEKIH